jgi:hypothetical protein
MGRADHSILDKYDEVRRSIYRNFIDPVSTSNFMRVSTSDPETILEEDPVMATFARMHDDSKIRDDFDRVCLHPNTSVDLGSLLQHIYGILHDFTQYYSAGKGQASL